MIMGPMVCLHVRGGAVAVAVLVLVVSSVHVHGGVVDPRYAKNITLYHVNERNYSAAPLNMNTADIDGDM